MGYSPARQMPEYLTFSDFMFLDVFPESGVKEGGRKIQFFGNRRIFLVREPGFSRIRKQFKVELRLQAVFESLTVADSAVAVVELQNVIKPSPGHVICSRRGVSAKIEQLSPTKLTHFSQRFCLGLI